MFLSLSLTERSKRLNPLTEDIGSPMDEAIPSTSSSSSARPVGSRFTAPLLHQSLSKTRRPFWSSCTLQPNEVSHKTLIRCVLYFTHHALYILTYIMHSTSYIIDCAVHVMHYCVMGMYIHIVYDITYTCIHDISCVISHIILYVK